MQPDDIDKLFRGGLEGHRTPPPRDLWERLEDELHPPKRQRRAAWWPLAAAAVLLLFLLAGGGFWLRGGSAGRGTGSLATTTKPTAPAGRPGLSRPALRNPAQVLEQPQKKEVAQATAPASSPSAALKTHRNQTPLLAAELNASAPGPGSRQRERQRSRPSGPTAAPRADHPARPSFQTPAGTDVALGHPAPAPAVGNASTASPTPADLASTTDVIEVEVRRGSAEVPGPAATLAAAPAAPAEEAPRGRFGLRGLLNRGVSTVTASAKQGLAVVRSLPDNVTVQANVAGHTLSKTIQL